WLGRGRGFGLRLRSRLGLGRGRLHQFDGDGGRLGGPHMLGQPEKQGGDKEDIDHEGKEKHQGEMLPLPAAVRRGRGGDGRGGKHRACLKLAGWTHRLQSMSKRPRHAPLCIAAGPTVIPVMPSAAIRHYTGKRRKAGVHPLIPAPAAPGQTARAGCAGKGSGAAMEDWNMAMILNGVTADGSTAPVDWTGGTGTFWAWGEFGGASVT